MDHQPNRDEESEDAKQHLPSHPPAFKGRQTSFASGDANPEADESQDDEDATPKEASALTDSQLRPILRFYRPFII